jgi:hypothetical protein
LKTRGVSTLVPYALQLRFFVVVYSYLVIYE